MQPTQQQSKILNRPLTSKVFLQGPAGTGKTTAGIFWLKKLLDEGVPPQEILIFVPQRTLALPYENALRQSPDHLHEIVNTVTLGGLARRMVDLYWPLVSEASGVGNPNLPPHFLTMETAQYFMAHLVHPLIENEGAFESLTLNRNRIYAQIIDNLNKSAIVGFPYQEIAQKLKAAWIGDIEQLHIYDDVQQCANLFRQFCLDNNLLDFSLQVDIFRKYLWPSTLCQNHLKRTYRHLIVDNVEEDTPAAHDLLKAWLPAFESALIIFDEDGGFRFFLGADPQSGAALRPSCQQTLRFDKNLINSDGLEHLKFAMQNALARFQDMPIERIAPEDEKLINALVIPKEKLKYFPAMISWTAHQIQSLIEEGVPPNEIVVLAPYMPDVVRFSLSTQLDEMGIPNQSHRPSRSLRDEPATQTLLTLARIAFPSWHMIPDRITLSNTLMQVIQGLDLVRAQLLTEEVYQKDDGVLSLAPFEKIARKIQQRVTFRVGERYERLRKWLEAATLEKTLTLDFFLNRLFGEVLSQPGFRFHQDLNSGNVIANLIESIQKFRWSTGHQFGADQDAIGKEYLQMVADGVIAAQYIQSWEPTEDDAVFIAPAYTFLISNRPVDIQIWLDIGSPGWYQRLDQPLTQPYVLSRHWIEGQTWTMEDELIASHTTLQRLTLGLLNRCRKKIILGISQLDLSGYENRGLLIQAFQEILRQSRREDQ